MLSSIASTKACRVCPKQFVPKRPLQRVCSPRCALRELKAKQKADLVRAKAAARAGKLNDKARLAALDPISKFEKRAEHEVNRYVRLRDAHLGCISCHLPATWGGRWNASHFRSVGAATAVRFHLWNIHKACLSCNKFNGGNIGEYEPRLREKIGDAKVDWLRTQNQIVRYPRDYLARLASVFRRRANRLQRRFAA